MGKKATTLIAFAISLLFQVARTDAESIKIGTSRLLSYGGIPIAIDQGYFKEQGIDAELVFFDSAQPVAVAVTGGSVDFGVAGLSAAFYTLAGEGQLRMIAASGYEQPGFYNIALLGALKSYDAGLHSSKDLPGHSVAVTQLGTALQLNLFRLSQKFGFDFKAVDVKALQSNTNVISAVTGGTVDAAIIPSTPALPLIEKKEVKVLAWVGDDVPGSTGSAVFTNTKTANERVTLVKRFLVAYRKGTADFHHAFVDENGKRKDGPTAPAILAILAKFVGVSSETVDRATPYIDVQGRIDLEDIRRQVAAYTTLGQIRMPVKAEALIDDRYAQLLPGK